ncbi:MAG TPA: sugar phosphate isomerase/epimerase family protein [Chloroflexota bacterium]|nr:sugar phosphate isomerase/epimerase family protein [Chloroflexota bacterium]
MKVAYAFRRAMYYPYDGPPFAFPAKDARAGWLRQIAALGFDGIEVGLDAVGSEFDERRARELQRELAGAGMPCAAVRGGGSLAHPRLHAASGKRLEQTIRLAAWLGARVANTGLTTPPHDPPGPGARNWGEASSQGSSRTASEADYERTATALQQASALAADLGVQIAIEVHQHSIADNSWSALHLLDLVDRPNVGVNPDLGNIYWTYDEPEEQTEHAIVALAPRAKYWHCKNLMRLNIPQLHYSVMQRVSLPDGDIDYRFAISAMHAANYQGHLAVEGLPLGDQLTADGKSAAYVRAILRELEDKTSDVGQ